MAKIIEGNLLAKGKKFALVVSRFNEFITKNLIDGCMDTLVRHGASDADISLVLVPGAFELPATANKIVNSKKNYDAVICLGAVIRGATPHFDYVSAEVSKGIANVSMNAKTPVVFGIITADTIEQAIERAGTKSGNKGTDAAMTAIEMANLYKKL
jgi:6,7-dimethyl-8-ribityllumazine synthase